jgi:23S rRNA (cytidine1920-2'-O)/16S rRNA (cytidine1409-2'-O)-methyltransferase
MAKVTERLDQLLVSRGLAPTRSKAQALVLAGRVSSNGDRLEKSGTRLPLDTPLEVKPGPRYVSRAGHKLAGALDAFSIDPADRVALDVGASTGGFTQVLLERGARRIIALDVGRGQLDWSMRSDARVFPLEGCNARHLKPEQLPGVPSLVVIDVSFISTELILPAVVGCLAAEGEVATLIKPQFEVGRGRVGRGGIVRDPDLHRQVLTRAIEFCAANGWGVQALCASSLPGAEGNREFFLHIRPATRGLEQHALAEQIESAVTPPDSGYAP